MEWLKQQGPWCPALIEHLRRHHQQYDVLIFFTYLYAPTVLGLEIAPARSVLVSTAHDEPAIRLEIFKEVFGRPAALCYLTESERRFVQRAVRGAAVARRSHRGRRRPPAKPAATRACRWRPTRTRRPPTDDPADADRDDRWMRACRAAFRRTCSARGAVFRRRHRLYGPLALYGGRIDPGKGCEELIEYFSNYVKEGGDATLALMGVKLMLLPEEPFIRFAGTTLGPRAPPGARSRDGGRLSLAVREPVAPGPGGAFGRHADSGQRAQRRARRTLHPQQRRPLLRDREEFAECLKVLIGDARLRSALGRNGRDYVRRNYRWDVVLAKYERIFAKVRNAR